MLAEWKIPRIRRHVRKPSGQSQTAGAVRICDVSSVMLRGFDSTVSRVAAEESSLLIVSA